MVGLKRMLRHLLMPDWRVRQCFPPRTQEEVAAAIAASESRHAGEIRFVVESSLTPLQLLRGVTARDRAIEVFSSQRVWDTEDNSGVLIYLLLADRDVEIVADRGLNGRVSPDEWEAVCRRMEQAFGKREFGPGTLAAVAEIGCLLADRLPPRAGDRNELPDRPVLL
ncbi:MAG: TPM domain-containing protein [Rhodocyclaceae bacterium]|nr:TPM domain-containing protein [Rhodocyclaceae bacterium]MCB1917768.1 TPM domain-containing protein [Rhodocyclaceae bacterium]MCP5296768.1 TPM domain-containing protein [Zoogloeaceae bacterium]MCW5594936.1 TPM domain-containing protein [Rhodocyclaceae bacterium]